LRPPFSDRTGPLAHQEPHTGPERLRAFEALSEAEQAEFYAALAERIEARRLALGEIEWPERRCAPVVRHSGGAAAFGHRSGDVLHRVPPPVYYLALTGEPVPPSGRVHCPAPDHEDLNPSAVVYPEPGRGFFCFACGRGGDAITLAALLTGIEPRGDGYRQLRRYVADRILGVVES